MFAIQAGVQFIVPYVNCISDSDQDGCSSSSNYIAKPFLECELESFGWNDILATLDFCANVHETKQCDDKGYTIKSIYMLQVINKDNSSTLNGQYDEEIILEHRVQRRVIHERWKAMNKQAIQICSRSVMH